MRKRESVELCPFFSSLTNECRAAQRAAEAKKRSDLDPDKKPKLSVIAANHQGLLDDYTTHIQTRTGMQFLCRARNQRAVSAAQLGCSLRSTLESLLS